MTDEERRHLIDRTFESAEDEQAAVKRVVLLVLKSPWFLYREVGIGEFDDLDVASWMSFAPWDSVPSPPLIEAASRGWLREPDQIRGQAQQMLQDVRTRSKLREFFHQWLKVDHFRELVKDSEVYPQFDDAVASDLRTSLELFIDHVVWSDTSDFRQLLLSDHIYLNRRLAGFYGADASFASDGDADFVEVALEPEHRAGILSHPYLLSGFADDRTSSPIHRGVFVIRSLLGRRLNPPPIAVAPVSPHLHPDLTTRERVILQTGSDACVRCHGMINPLGFSLENFDAVGRYRDEEHGKPIDAAGTYITQAGTDVHFTSARDLATFLAGSEEAQQAFVEHLFHYTIKQPVRALGDGELQRLREFFVQNEYNIQKLLVEIVTSSAVQARQIEHVAATTAVDQ